MYFVLRLRVHGSTTCFLFILSSEILVYLHSIRTVTIVYFQLYPLSQKLFESETQTHYNILFTYFLQFFCNFLCMLDEFLFGVVVQQKHKNISWNSRMSIENILDIIWVPQSRSNSSSEPTSITKIATVVQIFWVNIIYDVII